MCIDHLYFTIQVTEKYSAAMYYRCASPLVKVLVAPALAVLLVLAAAAVASLLAVLFTLFSELVVPERGSY